MTVMLGGTSAMQDYTEMDVLLDMVAKHGVSFVYAAPVFLMALVAEQRTNPRDVSSLRKAVTGSAPIPPQLITEVREVLGVELGALWGMTENGPVTVTKPDDPPGWGAHSDGSPVGGSELRLAGSRGRRSAGCWCGARASARDTSISGRSTRACLDRGRLVRHR